MEMSLRNRNPVSHYPDTTKLGPRYFAMMIMLPGVYTASIVGISWVANTLPRPSSKWAAALALTNAIANCSSIYSPYLYPDSGAPRFILAMSVNAGTSLLSIFTATVFRFLLQRFNRNIDRREREEGALGVFDTLFREPESRMSRNFYCNILNGRSNSSTWTFWNSITSIIKYIIM